jgi:branched-chain amino acid transport system permease protein
MTSAVRTSTHPTSSNHTTGGFRSVPHARAAILALCVVATVSVPFVFDSFRVLQAATVLVWIMAALSLNLLSGFGGILSVGAGAFVGFGAYVSAILRVDLGLPFALSIAAAALFCFVVGVLVGLPALRLRGLYLALVTLGLASCLPLVLKRFDGLTGGGQGFVVEALPDSMGLASDQITYLAIWVICALALLAVFLLIHGPAGRAVMAMRDNEIVASSFGVNPAAVKTLLFGVSSAIGGAAGACYVATVGYVAPDAFPLHLSIVLLIACVVGGLRTVGGAVVAGLFVVYAPVIIGSFFGQSFADVVYGVLVILVLLAAPGGVAGEWQRRRALRVLGKGRKS